MTADDMLVIRCLLLPVAFLSGWMLSRKRSNFSSSKVSPDYFKGLNYVLNEQPDKAIEVFIKMLEVDSETVETHLALGNLFRRRGEVDRAIRIHQNLIARPNLDDEYRSLALLELGMDYMRSGLLDRAEGLFRQLIDLNAYTTQAFTHLLAIYQQEKDWDNAIACARRLETLSGEEFDPVIAHFYCELASEDIRQGKVKEARESLRKALNMDPKCVRASLIEGELLIAEEKYKSALKAYKRVEKQDVQYIAEVIPSIVRCYRKLEQISDAISYLRELHSRYGGITTLLCLTDLIVESEGEASGISFIAAELQKRPTVRGVDRLVEFALQSAVNEDKDNLQTIKELTGRLLSDRSSYRCEQCGFDAKLIHWQCPSCQGWATIKPVYGVDGE